MMGERKGPNICTSTPQPCTWRSAGVQLFYRLAPGFANSANKKDCLREISRGARACCDATSLEWRTVINYLHLRRCKSLPLLWRSRSTRSSTTARGPAGRPARVLANLKAYRVEKTNVWPTLDS